MSKFRLVFQRLHGLSAEIGRKVVDLKAQISAIDTTPEVELKQQIPYRGRWTGGAAFGGSVKKLFVLYRFIAAKSWSLMGHSAELKTAPAKETASREATEAAARVKATARPVKQITVNHRENLVSRLLLQALRKADVVTKAEAYLKVIAEARVAKSAAAMLREQTPNTFSEATVFRADSAVLPLWENKSPKAAVVDAATARANDAVKVLTADGAAAKVTVGTGAVQPVTFAAGGSGAVSHVRMATWIEPYFDEDGALVIRQVYQIGRMEDGRLVIH